MEQLPGRQVTETLLGSLKQERKLSQGKVSYGRDVGRPVGLCPGLRGVEGPGKPLCASALLLSALGRLSVASQHVWWDVASTKGREGMHPAEALFSVPPLLEGLLWSGLVT